MLSRRSLVTLALVVGLLALTLSLWRVSNRDQVGQLVAAADVTGEQFGLRFKASVRERLVSLSALTVMGRATGGLELEQFVVAAPYILEHTTGLVALMLVNAEGVVVASSPEDYGDGELDAEHIRAWMAAAVPADLDAELTGVVDLPGRQRGLVAVTSAGTGRGQVIALLSLSELVGPLFGEAMRNRYGIELHDDRGGRIFHLGDPEADERFRSSNAIQKSIRLGEQEFFLTVRPYATVTVPRENRDGWLIVCLGVLLSGAIGLVFWEVGARAETLERMVGERTLELQDKHRELEIQHRRVLEATRLKSEFLANMTHELKSPIHSILTLSELLNQGLTGELNDEQRRQVKFIHRSGGDLLSLIEDILTSARLESEKIEVERSATAVGPLIDGLRESSSPLIASKGLSFEARIAGDLAGPVSLDEEKLRLVLGNLISNAIKFTPDEGRIEIDAQRVEQAEDPDPWLQISVSDTGIGIARRHQEVIFEEFRQVDGSIRRRFGGTGLGLALARKLALQMEGTLSVSSEVGRGSTFTLRIPLRDGLGEVTTASLDGLESTQPH